MFIIKPLLFILFLAAIGFIVFMCSLDWKKIGRICLLVIAAGGIINLVLFIINAVFVLFLH